MEKNTTPIRRYSLGRICTVCPQCGRHTFKPYIDNATGRPLDAAVCGRCNREVKCRYHLPPARWFAEGGKAPALPEGWTPPPPPKPDYCLTPPVPTLPMLSGDKLFRFLAARFGGQRVLTVFQRYRVLHSRWNGGATAFFLLDAEGNCRSAKLMRYGDDGHRLKSADPAAAVTYLHAITGKKPFCYRACFFGEHLATQQPDKTLVLVESEKTALIMACDDTADSAVYMATGGASALRPRPETLADPFGRFAPLQGRNVLLYPDADMTAQWQQAAQALTPWCRSIAVADVTRPPCSLTGSADIGDLILSRKIENVKLK